jgi:hypothetical protein
VTSSAAARPLVFTLSATRRAAERGKEYRPVTFSARWLTNTGGQTCDATWAAEAISRA